MADCLTTAQSKVSLLSGKMRGMQGTARSFIPTLSCPSLGEGLLDEALHLTLRKVSLPILACPTTVFVFHL